MKPFVRYFFLTLLGLMALSQLAFSQQKIYVLELRNEVDFAASRYFTRGFAAAQADGAELIIVHLDTYGGRVDYADSIRAHILNSKIPTAVFIDRNAGSAGALISIACDSIYMAPGASIGAATVVDEDGEPAIDKYQSYWRGVMRATAEANGRNPQIAEKMVDQNLEIVGLSPMGKIITFTNADAIANGYCEGTKNNVAEVAAAFGFDKPQIVHYEGSTPDKAIDMLNSPTASAILLVLLFGGIFLELKAPGTGKGAVISIVSAFLFFGPHYVNGFAESWEVGLFLLGVILLALELFVIPGFGVAGVLGILFTVVGVTAALLENNGTDFEYVTTNEVLKSLATVLVLMSTSILLVIWFAKILVSSKSSYPFVDQAMQTSAAGFTALRSDFQALVGMEGEAKTDLRPVGHVVIDGKSYDAEAGEGYIVKGEKILVERLKGVHLMVKKL